MRKWAVFHGAVLALFLASLVLSFLKKGDGLKIEADLLNMIPKSFSSEDFSKADAKMTENVNRNIVILAKNADFETAKADAEKLYLELEKSGKFESISFHNDESNLKTTADFLFENRYNFLTTSVGSTTSPTADTESVEASINEISQNALYKAYSPFTLTSLDLEKDPFLLAETALENYLASLSKSGFKMTVKDGVFASEIEGFWHVMIRGILKKEASALLSKDNAVIMIKNAVSSIKNSSTSSPSDSTDFIFSGTPFHSYASSTSAAREIAIISIVSITAVVFLLLFVFRSPLPIFTTVLTIGLSILSGFLATLAIFKSLHVLVLVFATSLIGSCIDYSLHYFVNWKGNSELKNGNEIKTRIFSGLSLSFASTVICYAALFLAPYNLLRQMALFSITGFVSTYLTVLCVYPKFPLPAAENRTMSEPKIFSAPKKHFNITPRRKKIIGRIAVSAMFVFSIAICAIFHKGAKIQNNVASLYTMKGKLLSDEIEAAKAIGMRIPGYFLIKGESEDEVLSLSETLDAEIQKKFNNEISILSAASFIPSIETQKKSRKKCSELLELSNDQLQALGFDHENARKMSAAIKLDFENKKNNFVTIENSPDFLKSATASLWIGKIDGFFYSAAMPSARGGQLSDEHEHILREIAGGNENILFLSKANDISTDLNRLTRLILKFFVVSYALIFIILKFFYSTKHTFKIISVPLLVILMTTAIFAVSNIDLEFFSITGMILVLGMGIDYIIYTIESEGHEKSFLERYAILLSFLTTELSFGILALSSFKPVHLIGLSIFIGLATAFFTANFYSRNRL